MEAVAQFGCGTAGGVRGVIVFRALPWLAGGGVVVRAELDGLVPHETHAMHIHEYGDFRRGCASAGGHWNPDGRRHGSQVLHGHDRHAGDLLNNVKADQHGRVRLQYRDPLLALSGRRSIIGRSVVVHAGQDDGGRYRDEDSARGRESATTGSAGTRIACAVIGHAAPPPPPPSKHQVPFVGASAKQS